MPTRATKRGAERSPLERDCDVLICGASFAGLAVARELSACGAQVLVIDRYEIGERQTSACGIPTRWLEVLGLHAARQQTFGELVIHTPHASVRFDLPWTFSTFDYRTMCAELAAQGDFEFETATLSGHSASA
jgi:flavin-dependent dehydrogenase